MAIVVKTYHIALLFFTEVKMQQIENIVCFIKGRGKGFRFLVHRARFPRMLQNVIELQTLSLDVCALSHNTLG